MNYSEIISVIVPIYNMEDRLERCIESIIRQTYPNLQIILVDDGSLDSSGKICDFFAKKDDRIVVVHQKNQGVAAARNTGLDCVKGQFIGFVDADDYIDPQMYEELIYSLKKYDADLVICGYKNIDFINKPDLKSSEDVEIYYGLEIIRNAYENIYCEDCREKLVVSWNKLWKREVFNGLRFPNGKLCEDAWLMHYAFNNTKKAVILHKAYYNYCYNQNSIMRAKFNENKLNSIYSIRDRVYFCEHKVKRDLLSFIFKEYINEILYLDDLIKSVEIEKENEKRIRKKVIKIFREDVIKFLSKIKLSKNGTVKLFLFFAFGWKYLKLPINKYLY